MFDWLGADKQTNMLAPAQKWTRQVVPIESTVPLVCTLLAVFALLGGPKDKHTPHRTH